MVQMASTLTTADDLFTLIAESLVPEASTSTSPHLPRLSELFLINPSSLDHHYRDRPLNACLMYLGENVVSVSFNCVDESSA
jgi:hypothetical protein